MAIGLGYFPASRFPLIGAGMVAAGLVICQLLAYYYGHQDLFPYSSIYNCAKHAPQYIFFRISVICGATLFLLTWLINYAYIHEVCPPANGFSAIVTFLGIGASLIQMLAAATIDTGVENYRWVIQTKNAFAVVSGSALTMNTILLFIVRKLNGGVKKAGVEIKLVINVILIVIGAITYDLVGGESPLRFICEYAYVLTTLAYYWSLSKSYKKYIIDYELTA